MYGADAEEILVFNGGAEALLALFFVAASPARTSSCRRRRSRRSCEVPHGARRRDAALRAAVRERLRARRRRDHAARRRAHEADPRQHAAQPERRAGRRGGDPRARRASRSGAASQLVVDEVYHPIYHGAHGALRRRVLARDRARRLLEVVQPAGLAHRLAARARRQAAPRARERARLLHDFDEHARRAAGRGRDAQSRDDLESRARRQRAESRVARRVVRRHTRSRSNGCGRAAR